MSKITFLKFGKSWNVLQASKYFSMIFKSLLDCHKVQDNFFEVSQVQECLASCKIFFYDFYKSLALPKGPKLLYRSLVSPASFKRRKKRGKNHIGSSGNRTHDLPIYRPALYPIHHADW